MEKIMSVYINTIGFGYVVLSDGEILDYGIVSIRPVQNDRCLTKIKEIACYYLPSILILEDYKKSNKSERVKQLIEKICECGEGMVKIYRYSKDQVKNTFDVFGARNKFEISKRIVDVYPQLKTKLPEKRKPWEAENYYQGIFDAMSLVLTHLYLL